MVIAGSGERAKYPLHRVPLICVQLERDLGILLTRAVDEYYEKHIVPQQSNVDVYCPAEKACHLSVEEMCSGYLLLYPAETPNEL